VPISLRVRAVINRNLRYRSCPVEVPGIHD